MCCDLNRAIPHAWWWLVVAGCLLPALHVRTPPISQLPTAPPHLLFLLSADLRVTVGAATDPYYHPLVLTSPPFRRLLCLHYGTLQPPTWWSSYAATYSPPTYHCCSRPASGPLLVLLPIPTPTPLSYPVTSPPFRRLLCLHYGALQPPTWWSSYAATYSPPTHYFCTRPAFGSPWVVLLPLSPPLLPLPRRQLTLLSPPVPMLCCPAAHSDPPHCCPPAAFPALFSAQPRIMATTIDPAQPELPSYLLASEKNTTTSCPAREKQADTKISTIFDLMVEIGSEKKHTAPHHSCNAISLVGRKVVVR